MKILIADNHTAFRESFRSRLQRFYSLGELHEVADFETLKALSAKKNAFDLVFVDVGLLGKEGLRFVFSAFPEARIAVLSESEKSEDILSAFDAGVCGYIPKQSSDTLIASALRLIMEGNVYIPPAILSGMRRSDRSGGGVEPRILSHALPDGANLTNRQSEVLLHLGSGLSNKQIAYEMSVSVATVKLHINALLRQLHVPNRTKAVVTAQRMGILEA